MTADSSPLTGMECDQIRVRQLNLLAAMGKAIFNLKRVVVIDALGVVARMEEIHEDLWQLATIRIKHNAYDPDWAEYQSFLLDTCQIESD